MSAPDVDVEKVPQFDKLRPHLTGVRPGVISWVDKLQAWCEAAAERIGELDKDVDRLQDLIVDHERAAEKQRDLEGAVERIEQRLEDTVRGIYTLEETMDWLRRGNR